ncbi:MAG TPA: hypothetical protein VK883_08640, partial [Arthrobacter sp.]|nr:hypothetical protein [Arthrobacter sp.]
YAIGVAAGTQALVILSWILLVGTPGELTRALLMTAAWVINLAVAEYVIHRRAQRSARAPGPAGPQRSARAPGPAGRSIRTAAGVAR